MSVKRIGILVAGYGVFSQNTIDHILHFFQNGIPEFDIDVDILGIIEPWFDNRMKAKEFLRKNDIDAPSLNTWEAAHEAIYGYPGQVFVRDASSTEAHVKNHKLCREWNWFHFVEKPIALEAAELDTYNPAVYDKFSTDFVEVQNPAIIAASEYIEQNNIILQSITCLRVSSIGWDKICNPSRRRGVQGGSNLDKSIHDWGVVISLLNRPIRESINAKMEYFVPASFDDILKDDINDFNFMNLYGKSTPQLLEAADLQISSTVKIKNENNQEVEINMHSGWGGTKHLNEEASNLIGNFPGKILYSKRKEGIYTDVGVYRYIYNYEDIRICKIEGSLTVPNGEEQEVTLYINMLNRPEQYIRPFVKKQLENGEIVDIPLMHDDPSVAFRRSLRDSLLIASGVDSNEIGTDVIDADRTKLCHQIVGDCREAAIDAGLPARKEAAEKARNLARSVIRIIH